MMAGKVIKGSMCLHALGQTNVGAQEDKSGPDIGIRDEGELVQTTRRPCEPRTRIS